jgi:hypothetical protein
MARPTILTQRALTRQAGSSFSLAYTIHADTTYARVSVVWDKSGGAGGLSCSGTLGGEALTAVDATPAYHAATNTYCQEFYRKNPLTGSQTLALTIAGVGGATEVYAAVTNDLKDVDLTTPIRVGSVQATSGLTDASSHWSQAITSDANDLTVSVYSGANTGVTSSDQTVDGAVNNTGAYSGASDHGTTGAASVTHVWTSGSGGSDAAVMFGYSIQGTGGAVAPTAGFSTSVNLKTVTVTDTSVAGTNPITSRTYDYDHGGAGSSPGQTATQHTYLVGGTYTIRQTVSDGTLSDTDDEAVTTKTRYTYQVVTAPGGRSASVTADRPDA